MSSEDKDTLRLEARRHRVRMDIRDEDTDAVCKLFFDTIKPAKGSVIAAYWPMGKELSTHPILERLLAEDYICALPVTRTDAHGLKFARWDESIQLKKGPHGAMEPESTDWVEPDIVIVPLLAFDRRGFRLGQGGGHYDATLRDLRSRKEILAVGLAYAQQACLFNLPIEDHDEKLDWVITPQEAHCFLR